MNFSFKVLMDGVLIGKPDHVDASIIEVPIHVVKAAIAEVCITIIEAPHHWGPCC